MAEGGELGKVGSLLVEAIGAPFAKVSRVGGLRVKRVSTIECPNMYAINKLDNQKWDSPICDGLLCLLGCQTLKQVLRKGAVLAGSAVR